MSENEAKAIENGADGLTRRHFIKGTAIIAGGVAISSIALLDACTKDDTSPPPETETFIFFNMKEAETVKAVVSRLIPGSAQDPGAAEAKAHIYIDHALAGTYASQQTNYRRGLGFMDAYSQSRFAKRFAELTAEQQDTILADMQSSAATGFYAPAAAQFFATLFQHTREGTFCDPIHGGNQNLAGWKMVGFPGAQEGYADRDMAIGFDQATKTIFTLAESQTFSHRLPQSGF